MRPKSVIYTPDRDDTREPPRGLLIFFLKILNQVTRLFSEIQFLEQNYDIVKCNIWMRQVTEIQNKVFEDNRVQGKKIQHSLKFISSSSEAENVKFSLIQFP